MNKTFLSTILYSLARLGLLALFLGVGYYAGLRGYVLIIVGFLVSAVASLFLLDGLRDRVSVGLFNTKKKLDDKIDAAAAAEDAWLDEQLRKQEADRQDDSEPNK
jgi:hypothetical protein